MQILPPVDFSHPSATELFEDAVVRNRLPNERVGIRDSAAILGCVQPPVASSHGRGSAGSTIATIGLLELIFKSNIVLPSCKAHVGSSHP
jgi:hypothetical protein